MDDVISISDIYSNEVSLDMKLAPAGIAVKSASTGQVSTIESGEIASMELFRGVRKITLRVYTATNIYSFTNIEDTLVEKLKDACYRWYNQIVYFKELNIYTPTSGSLSVDDIKVVFGGEKASFDIPINRIESVYESKNDLVFIFKDNGSGVSELTFSTQNKNLAKHLRESSSKSELITFESIQTVFPRGKMNYVFYDDYVKIIGQTHSHKLFYSDVKEVYLVDKDLNDKYCAIRIEPLRQGNTKYDFLVLSFDDTESDFDINDKSYKGLLSETFTELVCDLTSVAVERGANPIKCIAKAYEGAIYVLEKALLFLPKALLINVSDITLVEFSRINFSRLTSKTFDMRIMSDGMLYNFDGLPKEEFSVLELFLSNHGVKVQSEIIADNFGEEEDDDSETDLDTTSE